MLEGLYSVDWNNLRYANGKATDVPGMLLALASPKAAERQMGLVMLRGALLGPRTVYEAAAAAVPFLLQLCEHPGFEEKAEALALLAEIASGVDWLDETIDPPPPGELDKKRRWAEDACAAVRKGRSKYVRCMDDGDPRVRAASAYLLASIGREDLSVTVNLALRMNEENDPGVLASLVYAIAETAPDDLRGNAMFAEAAVGAKGDLPELAAHMSRIRRRRENASQETIYALVDVLSDADNGLAQAYAGLPWAESHLYADIALRLCYAGPKISQPVLPDLMRALDMVDSQSALTIAYALLYLGFGGVPIKEITGLQRAVLATVVDSPVLWKLPEEAGEVMGMFGLPGEQESIKKLMMKVRPLN